MAPVALRPTDLIILVVYLLAMVGFGLYMGHGTKTADGYSLGGRNLPWWALLLSIVATETSTVTFLSIPGVAYEGNLTWLQLPMGFALGRLLVVALLLPGFFKGQIFSAYSVLQQSFGNGVKRAASVLFLTTRTLADGLRLMLSAFVLHKILGEELWLCILLVGLATILYTYIGGMRAVVWLDCIQFVVYMLGAVVAFYIILEGLPGGWGQLQEVTASAGKLQVVDLHWSWSADKTLWAGLIGGAFVSLATHGADQLMVQRYLSARSQRQAGWALALSGPIVLLQFAFFLLLGLGLYAFYQQHPPTQAFSKGDEVFASFIVHELPVGVQGLVLGAVFSAAMSTLSSSLNSSATSMVHDLLPLLRRKTNGDNNNLRATMTFTLVFGLLQILVALSCQGLQKSIVDSVFTIASLTMGVLLGLFLLALPKNKIRPGAAMLGLITGLACMLFFMFFTDLAWPWFPLLGSSITVSCGYLVNPLLRSP